MTIILRLTGQSRSSGATFVSLDLFIINTAADNRTDEDEEGDDLGFFNLCWLQDPRDSECRRNWLALELQNAETSTSIRHDEVESVVDYRMRRIVDEATVGLPCGDYPPEKRLLVERLLEGILSEMDHIQNGVTTNQRTALKSYKQQRCFLD